MKQERGKTLALIIPDKRWASSQRFKYIKWHNEEGGKG